MKYWGSKNPEENGFNLLNPLEKKNAFTFKGERIFFNTHMHFLGCT